MCRTALLIFTALNLFAAPIRFDFTFLNAQSGATAIGYIVFEDTLLPNPGDTDFILPNPAVLDLQVTVSGASSGNGSFTLADFVSVRWDTNGGVLDFAQELIGQPTSQDLWGTIPPVDGIEGTGGDFNIFSVLTESYGSGTVVDGAAAPNGVWFFTLGAGGGSADPMQLISMRGMGQVPALGSWGLAALFIGLAGMAIWLRRVRSAA